MSLRTKIAALRDRTPVKEPVAEWGIDVWLAPMSGKYRSYYEFWCQGRKAKSDKDGTGPDYRGVREMAIAFCLCEEDGTAVYVESDGSPLSSDATICKAIAELSERNPVVLDRLATKALKLSGMAGEDEEETEKNLPSCPNSGSGST